MIKELEFLDKKLYKKFLYVLKETKCTKQEALEYLVNDDPVLWAKVYLNWQARDYQLTILRTAKKSLKLVLRLGRRLGKTECMCVLIFALFLYFQDRKLACSYFVSSSNRLEFMRNEPVRGSKKVFLKDRAVNPTKCVGVYLFVSFKCPIPPRCFLLAT